MANSTTARRLIPAALTLAVCLLNARPALSFSNNPIGSPVSRRRARTGARRGDESTFRTSTSGSAAAGDDDAGERSKSPPAPQPAPPGDNPLTSAVACHHAAVKTRDIENAIKFYSLLGFEVETKFVAGPARAAWLLHKSSKRHGNSHQSRIELIEVPDHVLNEPEGKVRRAVDLTRREDLLGLNHVALDVTGCIPRPSDDGGAAADGTACALYQLREWMDDLNDLSVETFGRTVRVALEPTKRIVGREVYEMAFVYDADGTLLELLNHSGTLGQEVESGWTPWDGRGFVQ